MGSGHRTAAPHPDREATRGRFQRIQRAERNLWLLALLLFVLLAVSLFLIDAGTVSLDSRYRGLPYHFVELLGNYEVSVALLLVVGLICGYFYEKLAALRRDNRDLIETVESNARLLELRNRQLETWHRVSHDPVTNFNLPRLLELVAHTAADMTESDCAAVVLLESEHKSLRLMAVHERGLEIELARRVAATAIRARQVLAFHAGEIPAEFDRPDLPWEGLAAIAAAPLISQQKAVGVLLIARLEPGEPFSPEIVDSLDSFASQAAVALEKANLYAENQRKLQQLSRVVHELQAQAPGPHMGVSSSHPNDG